MIWGAEPMIRHATAHLAIENGVRDMYRRGMVLRFCIYLILMVATVNSTEIKVYGWGHGVKVGEGGMVYLVTRLDDDVKKPVRGMLRWALTPKGPRIIRFAVEGDFGCSAPDQFQSTLCFSPLADF